VHVILLKLCFKNILIMKLLSVNKVFFLFLFIQTDQKRVIHHFWYATWTDHGEFISL